MRCWEAPHGKLGRPIFILGIAVPLRSTFNSGVGSDNERSSVSHEDATLSTIAKSNTWRVSHVTTVP